MSEIRFKMEISSRWQKLAWTLDTAKLITTSPVPYPHPCQVSEILKLKTLRVPMLTPKCSEHSLTIREDPIKSDPWETIKTFMDRLPEVLKSLSSLQEWQIPWCLTTKCQAIARTTPGKRLTIPTQISKKHRVVPKRNALQQPLLYWTILLTAQKI